LRPPLPAGPLPEACRDDAAHDAFVHARGFDTGTGDGFAYRDRSELGGGQGLERTEEAAGRRARGGEDNGLRHWVMPKLKPGPTYERDTRCDARRRGRAGAACATG